MPHQFLPHTSEIKFQASGKTLDAAFEAAVEAFAEFVSNGNKVKSAKAKIIDVAGDDRESLLYNFIEELITLVDAEHFLAVKAKVTMRGNNLRAELFGDTTEKYDGLNHVKAPTFSEMFVRQDPKGWMLQAVIDV